MEDIYKSEPHEWRKVEMDIDWQYTAGGISENERHYLYSVLNDVQSN